MVKNSTFLILISISSFNFLFAQCPNPPLLGLQQHILDQAKVLDGQCVKIYGKVVFIHTKLRLFIFKDPHGKFCTVVAKGSMPKLNTKQLITVEVQIVHYKRFGKQLILIEQARQSLDIPPPKD